MTFWNFLIRVFPVIDWVSMSIPLEVFPEDARPTLIAQSDHILRFHPVSGEVKYEIGAWDSIRSDSHSISARCTGSIVHVQGSPARIIGDGDNVFSSGASAAEDLVGCVTRMAAFYLGHVGVPHIPPFHLWDVTRVDITRNLALDSLAEVRQSLAYLRNAEGGRYRVNQPDGDTVYWNKTSRYKKAKSYAKGPHLRYQMGRNGYEGRQYTPDEISLASNLIRLELTIFKRYWQKQLNLSKWHGLTPEILNTEWHNYFSQFMGHSIMNDEQLKQNIMAVAPTEGQGKAAYNTWWMVKSQGWELARENQTKATWYRNLKILRDAGLKVTDLGNGKIIPFKVQRLVIGREVRTWQELRKAA